ncbi:hypothetical protein [Microbacterium sp. che218]|uniref:hypothetical protein n=1 Tax=Microbacterium sp. che218 TaxID=3140649 RepID=UPI00336957FC
METVRHVRGHALLTAAGRRLEPLHPSWVERHPAAAGWIWLAAMAVLIVVVDLAHGPEPLRVAVSLSAALPSLGATLLVLSQTPRAHLESEPSILGHFFARFFALLGALILWIGSVVLGAAVAVQLTEDSRSNTEAAWEEALEIFGAVVPFIVAVLWAVLIFRCVGYIARLRGWAPVPTRHRIPEQFFAESPRTRRVVVGLAHPALLLVAGTLSIVLVFVAAGEVAFSDAL